MFIELIQKPQFKCVIHVLILIMLTSQTHLFNSFFQNVILGI